AVQRSGGRRLHRVFLPGESEQSRQPQTQLRRLVFEEDSPVHRAVGGVTNEPLAALEVLSRKRPALAVWHHAAARLLGAALVLDALQPFLGRLGPRSFLWHG